jgi:hypothetical protein
MICSVKVARTMMMLEGPRRCTPMRQICPLISDWDVPTQTPKALHPAQFPTCPRRTSFVTPFEWKWAEPGFVQNKVPWFVRSSWDDVARLLTSIHCTAVTCRPSPWSIQIGSSIMQSRLLVMPFWVWVVRRIVYDPMKPSVVTYTRRA